MAMISPILAMFVSPLWGKRVADAVWQNDSDFQQPMTLA
jgi:hypothetical protein